MTWIPVEACTLPTAEQPLRVAEFDALFASLLSVERVSAERVVLRLAGGAEVAARARDLAQRETACCSFFSFAVEQDGDEVRMEVAVPAAQVGVLEGLLARAE